MESYEKLLDEAYEKIKPISVSESFERFEIPKAEVNTIGNKTYIDNYMQIASYLRREPENLCKFISKELAAFCKIEGDRLMINRKIPSLKVNEKISLYVKIYVICQECKKPDTELIKQGNFLFIHCLACGAKHSLGRS
ncbi:MAG: translation initiation factor IF-2 subunit beta [Candidatus Pacearchaeota archaeon]